MPILTVRVTDEQRDRIVRQSEKMGFGTVSAYMRACAASPLAELVREIHTTICNTPRYDLPPQGQEAVEVLIALQVPKVHAARRVQRLLENEPDLTTEDLIRKATSHDH